MPLPPLSNTNCPSSLVALMRHPFCSKKRCMLGYSVTTRKKPRSKPALSAQHHTCSKESASQHATTSMSTATVAGSFVLPVPTAVSFSCTRSRTAASAYLPRHARSSVEGVHRQHLPRFYQSRRDRNGAQGCEGIGRRKRDRKEKCVGQFAVSSVCLILSTICSDPSRISRPPPDV